MAGVSIFKAAYVLAFIVLVFSVAASVSAQDSGTAASPAPSMDTGSAFSLPISGAIAGASLLFSLLAVLKH